MRGERAEGQGGEPPTKESGVLGRAWHSSWGLRLSLGFITVLVWAGTASVPSSPTPASGASVSPPATTPVVAPTSAPSTMAPAAATATPTATLPQQTLDITYDYGPGPQPVPGQSAQLP